MPRKRVAILISGRGSNMSALIDAARAPNFPAEIVVVISNRPDAAGLARASEAGIATKVIDHKPFGKDRAAFEAVLKSELAAQRVDLICLAGFMRLFTREFVEAWDGRMLNIHPSLLPSFPGLDPHGQAIRAGVKLTGATVHFVIPEMDSGPIIAQQAVPVEDDDTSDTLAARVLAAEHQLYPQALKLVAEDRVRIVDGCTRVS
ncbi:phosphoribosylglycinamide formyltransferase [Variibacter gotjawalensis]|uniref:Phosphoribosylglycinamide formyltransferase n=1 Tax=Variibacter gotjawalensis TaxID=1333996 RepID=A0A0S3PYH1_9BRAD|nr:phosphoribosylglycinamide formyltransferase [Variibacter gotjawalensis]NIK46784.1 phosphoribosylglycinamide formyltransferase-1 [Variibacter gotjawalensis]RZS48688.1 formyltetrahydrofolate-dependent phosphoribosylglycinamide formyltransferase [Variibacter gotjawalensis]BAT60947.1 phosphoribosylglycinamide formyltransferase [Variibacter gotjawalensis]